MVSRSPVPSGNTSCSTNPAALYRRRDPAGRPRVIDLVGGSHRLFPVGRLDLHSEGLILVTNDGELANLLMHPRYGVEKTYLVQVAGVPTRDDIARLERGVHLAEGYAHAKRVRVKKTHGQSAVLEIVLDEGRNREVRRLLARIGHKVLRLRRTALGPLRLGNLSPGEYRPLRSDEIQSLRDAALATRSKGGAQKPKTKPAASAPSEVRQQPVRSPAPPRAPQVPDTWSSDEPVRESERPEHTGTIIGGEAADASWINSHSAKAPGTPPSQPRPTIKPIIDVRRGIFPGAANDDDDDFGDDVPNPPKQPAARQPTSKQPARKQPARKHPKPAARQPRDAGKPPRRKPKGRRR